MKEQIAKDIAGIIEAVRAHAGNVMLAASIETDQSAYMRKGGKGNPVNPYHGDIVKTQEASIACGFIYANAVNKERLKDGLEALKPEDFDKGWGTLTPDRKVVELDGKLYLYGKMTGARNQRYFRKSTGEEIAYSELQPHFYPRKPNAKAEEVEPRKITLTNIASVRLDDVEYVNTEFISKIAPTALSIAHEAEAASPAASPATLLVNP
jgi:hypothetical protein